MATFFKSYGNIPLTSTLNNKPSTKFLLNLNPLNPATPLIMIKPHMRDININSTRICDSKHFLLIPHTNPIKILYQKYRNCVW